MSITFTFRFTLRCFRCGQTITTHDLSQGNCQFIFPEGIIQHQVCPRPHPDYLKECGWNTNQKINFNLN